MKAGEGLGRGVVLAADAASYLVPQSLGVDTEHICLGHLD